MGKSTYLLSTLRSTWGTVKFLCSYQIPTFPHQIFTMSSSSTSMSGELSLSQHERSQQQSVFSFMSLESEIDRLQCVNAQLIEENMRHRKLNMPDVDLELDLLAAEIERLRRENKQLKQENDDLRFLTRTDTEITDESRFLQECMDIAHQVAQQSPPRLLPDHRSEQ